MKKSIYFIFALLISTLLLSSTVFGANAQTTMSIVEKNICNITLNDVGNFEKQIVDSDLSKKEVTLELKLTNLNTLQESEHEIFLVIDNSKSMDDEVSTGVTRKDLIIKSAEKLAKDLLTVNSKIKIGIVSFSSSETNEGTLDDAKLELNLTSNSSSIINSISSIAIRGARTNIEAGLTLASQNFSSSPTAQKHIILLTDGVPNNAVGGPTSTYSGETATKTKTKLESISNSGIDIIAMMTGVYDIPEPTTNISYKQLAEDIFGTPTNPTAGTFYYITDTTIEDTIQLIYSKLSVLINNQLKSITITDYFPQEIVHNFNFEIVQKESIGTVSTSIDTTTNSITWKIDLLDAEAVASLKYKLSLKETFDKKIIDKILPTNSKVEINYTYQTKTTTAFSEVSPKIVLKTETIPDNTITNTVIPHAGEAANNFAIFIVVILLVSVLGFILYKNRLK